jgi:hypothetical protein
VRCPHAGSSGIFTRSLTLASTRHVPADYWAFHKFLFNNQDQFSNPAFFNQTGSALYGPPPQAAARLRLWYYG